MITAWLDQESTRAAERYGMMTAAWTLLHHNFLSSPRFGTADQPASVVAEAYSVAEIYLETERKQIETALLETAQQAHTATIDEILHTSANELAPSALEHLSATQSYLIDQLIAQIHRNIAQLRHAMQQDMLEVSLSRRAWGLEAKEALVRYRLGRQSPVSFDFADRGGKKWTASNFVRTAWRHTLLALYNEMVMMDLTDHGLTTAAVKGEEGIDEIISIVGDARRMTYADVRDSVFHPNANVVLAMEPQHVPA